MGEVVAYLYLGLAELFAGLFPERFKEKAQIGPIWRRIGMALVVGIGSLVVGLVVAAVVVAVAFVIVAVAIGLFRAALNGIA